MQQALLTVCLLHFCCQVQVMCCRQGALGKHFGEMIAYLQSDVANLQQLFVPAGSYVYKQMQGIGIQSGISESFFGLLTCDRMLPLKGMRFCAN